ERLKVLKHQQDFLTKEAKDLRNFHNNMTQDALQKTHKKEEVARLMKDYHKLIDEAKFQEAYKTALVMRELDPDDPATIANLKMAQTMYRREAWDKSRANTEKWNWEIGNDGFDLGPSVTNKHPIEFDKEAFERIRNRRDSSSGINMLRPRTEK